MIRLRGWFSSRLESPLLLAAIAVVEYATPGGTAARLVVVGLAGVLTAGFVAQSVRHIRLAARVRAVVRTRLFELLLTLAALILLASKMAVWARELGDPASRVALDPAYHQYAAAFILVAGLRMVAGNLPVRRILHRLELRPAQTVALGFAGAILAGTLVLSLPISVTRLEDMSLLDALFTATSAVTTTGLIVYDPGSFHTGFGQVALLALIQLGGLGTMVASASLMVLAGRRLRLRQAAALQESMDLDTVGEVRSLLKTILGMTAVVEGAGAIALYLLWRGRPEVEVPSFAALFHAVSAFCTAGFSTFTASLVAFRDDLGTNATVWALMLLGGLGFPILPSLGRLAHGVWSRRRVPLLSLHTRLALTTTAVLLGFGVLAGLILEWRGALAPLGLPSRIVSAVFLAATTQSTTGFNTVDTVVLAPATLWALILLMFVGGSPGSTAGGIKTTTFAAALATLRAIVRGRPRVEAFRRTIPEEQVTKALALAGIALMTVLTVVLALLATQEGDPLALTFEAVSAFGTVGLSAGATPALNGWGKAVIMAAMFVGRIGPLTLGFALAARAARGRVAYPAEKIMIG